MSVRLVCLLLGLLTAAAPALAQPATADPVPAAEAAFQNGLASYRQGDFAEAYRLFTRAASEYGFNARTTAATLMAARAALADADIDRAISAATTVVAQYPDSRYAGPARALLAEATGGAAGQGRPFDLGVILPVAGVDGYLGQALFNGVRIAVDEHNATTPRRPVRLIFRDSGASATGAESATREVAAAGADAVIGPLFSDEALAAAAVAETSQIPILAPLATDEAVSAGRRYAFQANPTFAQRGRAMARYAVNRLGLRRLGVAYEVGQLGADEGAAFATEARRLGAAVPFETRLTGPADWPDLDRRVGASALGSVQGIFLPTTGADAPRRADEALRALDALRSPPRPLGNTEWEGISVSRDRASRLGAVFTQDFFVAPGSADAFGRRYRELSGLGPDRLALIGYDVARFLMANLDPAEGSLADALRSAPRFQGVAHRFAFEGGQVNGALFILGYREGEAVLLE